MKLESQQAEAWWHVATGEIKVRRVVTPPGQVTCGSQGVVGVRVHGQTTNASGTSTSSPSLLAT